LWKVWLFKGAFSDHVGLDAIRILFGKYYASSSQKPIIFDFKYIEKNLAKLEKGLFIKRKKDFYDDGKKSEIQSYRDFVALAKKKKR